MDKNSTDLPTARKQAQPSPASPLTAAHIPKGVLLHILHSWGGGIARWTEDFIRHCPEQRNLILYSRSDRNVFGHTLELVDPAYPETPLAAWKLTPPIPATGITHSQYGAILSDLLTGLAVETVVVSSLIGHSLEALTTGLPTLRVLHDLYPYCPAMFGYFNAPCQQCNEESLTTCLRSNPQNECWHNSVTEDWLAMRRAYAAALLKPEVRLVAPSYTAQDRLYRLYPEIARKACHFIAHGIDPARMGCPNRPPLPLTEEGGGKRIQADKTRKLRLLVPGRLEPHKGLPLLRDALPQLADQAELLLLGCGMFGQSFAAMEGITLIPDYDFADLGPLVQDFAPDCALLLSTLPETFSYTLSEMWALGIPTLATNLGAFAERIHHGINGFLYEPDVHSLTELVASLAQDPTPLIHVARHLGTHPVRQAKDMVKDYQALLPTPSKTGGPGSWLALGIEGAQTHYHSNYTMLEQEVIRQAGELEKNRHQLEQTSHTLIHHQTRADVLERELTALRHSNSWRVTAPIRAIILAFRAFRTRCHQNSVNQTSPPPPRDTSASLEGPDKLPRNELEPDRALGEQIRESAHHRLKLRTRLREQLGIPDAARIVSGIAQKNQPDAAQVFIQAAIQQAGSQRNLYFLWLERDNMLPIPASLKARGLAMAPRRLHFATDSPGANKATAFSLPDYLAASDLIYLPQAGDATWPTAAEIALLKVPVISVPAGNDLTATLATALLEFRHD
ncbi:glycosyltransferase family 4 protein [Nitrosococcus wardiae]|uniref:Glycosyltransferase n=1 Tax=Nitrosococcus wardiae TaxID=1814290 RepID=A0A4P7BUC4_9GAMM|nr:glycosyltransferase family 4 protein [Nitrosococcus wardiae]QBQ53518.1 glycosyltransferase [Nitrosococcus wardiae]